MKGATIEPEDIRRWIETYKNRMDWYETERYKEMITLANLFKTANELFPEDFPDANPDFLKPDRPTVDEDAEKYLAQLNCPNCGKRLQVHKIHHPELMYDTVLVCGGVDGDGCGYGKEIYDFALRKSGPEDTDPTPR